MIKRDITETVYEYDKEGKLVKKTVIETHEEENNTVITYPFSYLNGGVAKPYEATLATTTTTKCNCNDNLSSEYACNCTVTG